MAKSCGKRKREFWARKAEREPMHKFPYFLHVQCSVAIVPQYCRYVLWANGNGRSISRANGYMHVWNSGGGHLGV